MKQRGKVALSKAKPKLKRANAIIMLDTQLKTALL